MAKRRRKHKKPENPYHRYTGVIYLKRKKKWKAVITISGTQFDLGLYKNDYAAVVARDNFIIALGLRHKLQKPIYYVPIPPELCKPAGRKPYKNKTNTN